MTNKGDFFSFLGVIRTANTPFCLIIIFAFEWSGRSGLCRAAFHYGLTGWQWRFNEVLITEINYGQNSRQDHSKHHCRWPWWYFKYVQHWCPGFSFLWLNRLPGIFPSISIFYFLQIFYFKNTNYFWAFFLSNVVHQWPLDFINIILQIFS